MDGRAAGNRVDETRELFFEVRRYRGESISHRHDFHQVVLPLEGRLNLEVGDARGQVSSKSIALIAAGVEHRFSGSKTNAFLVVDVPVSSRIAADESGTLLWRYAVKAPFAKLDGDLHRLVGFLAEQAERGGLHGPLAGHACALLLGLIGARIGVGQQGKWPPRLRALTGYLDAHLEWPITVATMAEVAHVSVSRLHALFRSHLGTSPQRYLTDRRMERARELMRQTTMPVNEVASRVGYTDQAAFARAFRRATGHAPADYRAAEPDR